MLPPPSRGKSAATRVSRPSRMLSLASTSSARWLAQIDGHLDEILIDHAHCEKKAAGVAMNLLFSYVDHSPVARSMPEIVTEELHHFRLVLDLLERRGPPLTAAPQVHTAAPARAPATAPAGPARSPTSAKAAADAASPARSPARRLSAADRPARLACHSAARAAASPATAAGTAVPRPARSVAPAAVRKTTPPAARADTAAAIRAAALPTRPATRSTWRLALRPVAHQVAKCSQLSTTGQ